MLSVQFSSVQFSRLVVSDSLQLTPWIAAHQASLSTNSRSSLRFTSIESVMPSSHLILCCLLLLLPPVPPSIKVFSNESTLRMKGTVLEIKMKNFKNNLFTNLLKNKVIHLVPVHIKYIIHIYMYISKQVIERSDISYFSKSL